MEIEVIKSRRKTMALQFKHADLLVVRVPMRTSQRTIRRFLTNHQHWINKQQEKLQQNPGLPESLYKDGGRLWLLGECHNIVVNTGPRHIIKTNDRRLLVSHPSGDAQSVLRQIKLWKRTFAEAYFEKILAEQSVNFSESLPPYRFVVRQMRRQWGNCARDGLIKLNVALIRYPEQCIRHVICHELCHLKHFNHSRDFYALLASVEPDWKSNKQLLQMYSG